MKWRTGLIFVLILMCFATVLIRIGTLTIDTQVLAVGQSQGSKTLTVSRVRGTIYDRNGKPIVNDNHSYIAAFMPEQATLSAVKTAVSRDTYRQLLDLSKERLPLSVKLNKAITKTNNLQVFRAPIRYGSPNCSHLIGYLNGNGNGVTGIEKAYESIFDKYTGELRVTFPTNGAGERMNERQVIVKDSTAISKGGMVLTIDKEIQQTVDTIADSTMNKGAVVVLNPNGEILALSSRPNFNPAKVDKAINQDDSPLVNRALQKYDCGSVFKIVTTASALEYGLSENQGYVCEGGLTIDNTTFHCHNRQGHGIVNMEQAFAQSCNLYFIQLAQKLGGERLLKTAKKLGLYDTISLADGIFAPPATLPSVEDLLVPAALANLSFGQGDLLVSPLHIARMTAVFAANGTIPSIRAVMGEITEDGIFAEIEPGAGETILSAANTQKLCKMLEQVVKSGTGSAANSVYTSVAGKTGTAETGQLDKNGIPLIQSWFTGYFPAENPRYIITVLVEDAGNNDYSAAEVVCEISNNLQNDEYSRE